MTDDTKALLQRLRQYGDNDRDAPADVGYAEKRQALLAYVRGLERAERNRDMWKGQCERQAAEVERLRAQVAPAELTSKRVNDACWDFIEALPHELPGAIFNDLKPALHAAICNYLAASPAAPAQQAAPSLTVVDGFRAQVAHLVDDLTEEVAGDEEATYYRLRDGKDVLFSNMVGACARLLAAPVLADDPENDPPAREASDWAPGPDYDGDGSVAAMARRAEAAAQSTWQADAFDNLLKQFEAYAHHKGEISERCQGKGWPEVEDRVFRNIRDTHLPKLREQLRALIAKPAAQGVELPRLPGAATIESQRRYSADQMRDYARAAQAPAAEPRAVVSAYRLSDASATKVERVQQVEGADLWAVRRNGDVLNKQGGWEWEPRPSERDDDFLTRCRFATADDAITAAVAAAAAA